MVELVIVLVLLGIISVFAVPKLMAAVSMRDDAWRDQVVGALRFAQKSAVARRRLTCVTITDTTVAVTSAATNPASACSTAMPGPDGSTTFASASNSGAVTTVSPAGTIFFQPDGRVTTDGAGTTSASRTISATGVDDITVLGETGHVE